MSDKLRQNRVFVKSFGCSSNIADGELMAGCLSEAGFQVTDSPSEADLLIYNTCAVKTPTENRVVEALKKAAANKDKRLIVAGCLPLTNYKRLKSEVEFHGVLGPGSSANVVEATRKVLNDQKIVWLSENLKRKPCLDLPRCPINPVVSIVPVAYGCLGSCSYCCVAFARGHLRSCNIDEVVTRVRRDLISGAKEVWLTGQDMACYGRDLGVNLADLLQAVCETKEEFWIRVGMMTPNLVMDILPDLTNAFQDKHIFKFLHLPVQSGDDEVLKRMNRLYSVDDFRHIVQAFRKIIPDITLATDVICGFPGESREAFKRTQQLIEDVKPDIVNVSKFFPRPRTAAEKMTPKISPSEVRNRSRMMADLSKGIAFENNSRWMNWRGPILFDERGRKPNALVGRNFAYKPVAVRSTDETLLGTRVEIQVVRTLQTHLEANLLADAAM